MTFQDFNATMVQRLADLVWAPLAAVSIVAALKDLDLSEDLLMPMLGKIEKYVQIV